MSDQDEPYAALSGEVRGLIRDIGPLPRPKRPTQEPPVIAPEHEWTTKDERSFVEHLGDFTAFRGTPDECLARCIALLTGYLLGAARRTRRGTWGRIRGSEVMELAGSRLAALRRQGGRS